MPELARSLSLAVPQIAHAVSACAFTAMMVWGLFWARSLTARRPADPHLAFIGRFTLSLVLLGAAVAFPAVVRLERGGRRELADAARSAAVIACGVVSLLVSGARRDAEVNARRESRIHELESDLGGLVGSLADQRRQLDALRGRAEAAATVDAATGLASRRLFDDIIGRELKRARKPERPIALAVAEIDHFERYIASFGRQASEGLLQAIAKLFAAQVRDTDLLVRFAPGRLAILMPETDSEKAVEIAEWIRSMVANSPLPHRAEMPGGRITVSFGVGAFPAPVSDAAGFVGAVEGALGSALAEHNRLRAVA